MNEEQNAISQMRAITVSREYGSGGGEIAARLAKRLNWQLIDHEVVVRVARELNVSEEEATVHDERVESLLSRVLSSFTLIQPTVPVSIPMTLSTDAQEYHEARRRVVEAAVATGHVVIVGRGAQVLLADRRDVLHVRIVAPLEQRIVYVMQREGLDQATAKARIQDKERNRIRYLQTTHNQNPEDTHLYDLVLNTHILGLDSVVELIDLALASKADKLTVQTGQLGPATGMTPYIARPADFRPTEEKNKLQESNEQIETSTD